MAVCHFKPACPFFDARKRGEGQKDGGKAKKVDREKGGDVSYSFSLSHIGLLSLLRCPEWSEKERENSRENEKYNRKLALVGRVVAMEKLNRETKK